MPCEWNQSTPDMYESAQTHMLSLFSRKPARGWNGRDLQWVCACLFKMQSGRFLKCLNPFSIFIAMTDIFPLGSTSLPTHSLLESLEWWLPGVVHIQHPSDDVKCWVSSMSFLCHVLYSKLCYQCSIVHLVPCPILLQISWVHWFTFSSCSFLHTIYTRIHLFCTHMVIQLFQNLMVKIELFIMWVTFVLLSKMNWPCSVTYLTVFTKTPHCLVAKPSSWLSPSLSPGLWQALDMNQSLLPPHLFRLPPGPPHAPGFCFPHWPPHSPLQVLPSHGNASISP